MNNFDANSVNRDTNLEELSNVQLCIFIDSRTARERSIGIGLEAIEELQSRSIIASTGRVLPFKRKGVCQAGAGSTAGDHRPAA